MIGAMRCVGYNLPAIRPKRYEAPTDSPLKPCLYCPLHQSKNDWKQLGLPNKKGRGVVWTWPIWSAPVGLDVVRSLMTLPELQKDEPNRHALLAMGIAEAYRCQRITQGKYRNFTPAHPA